MKTASKVYLRVLPAIGLALILLGYYYYTFELIEAKKELDLIQKTKVGLTDEVKNLEVRRIELINIVKQFDSVKTLQQKIISSSEDKNTVNEGRTLLKKVSMQAAKSPSVIKSGSSNLDLAIKMEKDGFSYVLKKDLNNAIQSFKASENAFNGYHVVYEIALYLERSKGAVTENPNVWNDIYKRLLKDYSWSMPKEYKTKLIEQIKSK